MTLVETLVALTVFAIVISTALGFMARQNSIYQDGIRRLVALRNLRYAISTLSQDLETLGTNVPNSQPDLFYADEDVIAFSADYATNIADDPFAVFHDPDAPNGQVTAPSGGFSIPNSGASVPNVRYESAPGLPSPAEILIFFVSADTSTSRSDDYVLYRQVNNNKAEAIARNLLHTGSTPFFSYQYMAKDTSGNTRLAPLPDSLVPIHHTATYHLAAGDTARSALADSIRAVDVRFTATNGLTGSNERTVELARLIPLPNAGFGQLATCGSPPLLGTTLGAAPAVSATGEKVIRLTWGRATDESGGEADVVRYVLYRRVSGAASWGDPYRAIPAGASTYSTDDAAATPGVQYEYALAAQDCTPALSSLTSAGPVQIAP